MRAQSRVQQNDSSCYQIIIVAYINDYLNFVWFLMKPAKFFFFFFWYVWFYRTCFQLQILIGNAFNMPFVACPVHFIEHVSFCLLSICNQIYIYIALELCWYWYWYKTHLLWLLITLATINNRYWNWRPITNMLDIKQFDS